MAGPRIDRGSFRRKGKQQTLYWRGRVPARDEETGKVIWVDREPSCGTSDQEQANAFRDAYIQEAFDALAEPVQKKPTSSILFHEAAARYVEARGRNEQFLIKIVLEMEEMAISDIDQDYVDKLAARMYPRAKASTLNRCVYTPISAVLNAVASKEYTPPRLKRPKGHLPPSNFRKLPRDWWSRVIPELDYRGVPSMFLFADNRAY